MPQNLPPDLFKSDTSEQTIPSDLFKSDKNKPIETPQMNFAMVNGQPVSLVDEAIDTAKNVYNTATTPLVDLRSGKMKEATDAFAQEHPIVGGGINLLADTISGLSSPLNLATAGAFTGESAAGKMGYEGVKKGLGLLGRGLSAPVAIEGGANVYQGINEGDLAKTAVGGLELAGGIAGMRAPKISIQPAEELPKLAPKIAANPSVQLTPEHQSSVQKLLEALKGAKPLTKVQSAMYTTERGKRFSAAEKVKVNSPESARTFMGRLAGAYEKIQNTPIELDEADVKSLYTIIGNHPEITVPETARAITGLSKILEGKVPQRSEIRLLEGIFGQPIESIAPKTYRQSLLRQGLDLSRVIQTSMDLSIPLRQGRTLIHTKSWWNSWDDMVRSFGNQKAYDKVMATIAEKPLFKRARSASGKMTDSYAEQVGLKMTDMINRTEETYISKLADKIPGVKASQRAAVAYINKLRADTLESLVKQYSKVAEAQLAIAKTPAEKLAAEQMDPMKNLVLGKTIAEYINSATGRGNLGKLERMADELNEVFYSPRMIKSRMDFFNPVNYTKNPLRKEYLKSVLGLAASWGVISGLAYEAGADVSFDTNSADFGKIKIGNSRIDPGAGFQQFLVLLERLRQGEVTSSTNPNRITKIGKGFKADSKFDYIERFLLNKLSPGARMAVGPWMATEQRPFYIGDENVRLMLPFLAQDIIEVMQDDPSLIPIVGIASILGMGTQTYDERGESNHIVPKDLDYAIGGKPEN